ncbi:centrosomal P4.1-associated protein [Aplochiton taeniatus]
MATAPPEMALTRKVAVAKGAELKRSGSVSIASGEPDLPPTSQLMARLFPSLKPKPRSPPSAAPQPTKTEETPGQQVQSRQLRERLVELELEIERFRTENAALATLRQESQRINENLRKERAEFEQKAAEDLARFEEYKKEETKKLQRERKVFEKHASAARAVPDKKERDEIQALKQQLTSMQDELKRRESRWSTTHVRLRQQIDTLSSDNSALKSEVNTLEKLRLAAWKKSQAEAERERENARERREREREWPRMAESTAAPVTKGVTFASPPIRDGPPQNSPATTRLSPRDNSLASTVLTKSSLRRKSAPSPSLCAFPFPDQSPEEKTVSVSGTQNTPPVNQDCSDNLSSGVGGQQTKTVLSKSKEQESNDDVITYPDGKVESVLPCGGRLIVFPNGTRKEVSADGETAKVTFFNGDTKQVMADHRVIYYYADARTTHTTYPDGIEVLQFPNNQTEKHFPDGRKEITFPDQTIKNLYPDGREESVLMDGTIIQVNKDGSKEIQFNTGQKEIHTADYKKREYPDGTVKTVYSDGRQETRYPNGRVRVKDKDGNIVMDNRP